MAVSISLQFLRANTLHLGFDRWNASVVLRCSRFREHSIERAESILTRHDTLRMWSGEALGSSEVIQRFLKHGNRLN